MVVRLENQAEPIPGYRLIERVGRGGFGEVWKVEAPGGLHKAIKFVYGSLEGAQEDGVAAEQELKALNRVKTVRHPFILSVERFDIIDGQLLIVMELADRNLWDRFRECRNQGLVGIPRAELLGYMEEAAEALDLMNTEYQLQHLDIKPQNLFLIHNHIKVADFGLVKDLEGMRASVTGGVTPLYAAPETFDGWISRFCDQYSLAIVYQELLTGQRPFSGTNARQLILQHLQAPPDLTALPPGDRDAIHRALAKIPDQRFPNCMSLVQVLKGQGAAPSLYPTLPAALADPPHGDTDPTAPTAEEEKFSAPPAFMDFGQLSRTSRPAVLSPESRMPMRDTLRPVRPQIPLATTEGGVLFPALVIGLGVVGLHSLQSLREALINRFGDLSTLPHLRMLYIDTDPEGLRLAVEGGGQMALMAHEILMTRLNRPSHYLKPREGQPPLDSWFDAQMLYRIPRNQLTTGLRALGRLAFLDNYRGIVDRLRSELHASLSPEALEEAVTQTGLDARSRKPRVYIVTSLAGGTGSGMFLDLAYVARAQLKQMGYNPPDVVGIFLLPPATSHPKHLVPLGNAYAALIELNHFSVPGSHFWAKYSNKERPLTDNEAPFTRCAFLPMTAEEGQINSVASTTGQLLFQELMTPLGRHADSLRDSRQAGHSSQAPTAVRSGSGTRSDAPPTGSVWSAVGMYRLTWPRQALLQRLARGLCQMLIQQWIVKDIGSKQEAVAQWVGEQWRQRELGSECLIDALEASCEQFLGEMPESAFSLVTDRLHRSGARGVELEPETLLHAFHQLLELVGQPDDETAGAKKAKLVEALDDATRRMISECEQRVAEMAVSLIEQPNFRLAGAEEAIRQINGIMEQMVLTQEPLGEKFASQADDVFKRLQSLKATYLTATRHKEPIIKDLVELLRLYPGIRYRALVLQRVTSIYRNLLSNCPEYLREISFCRLRLSDMAQSIGQSAQRKESAPVDVGRFLFPGGCRTIEEAVQRFLKNLAAKELLEFDHQIQEMIHRQFKAVVHVCMTSSSLPRDLELAFVQQAQDFVERQLGQLNAAQMFLELYTSPASAQEALADAWKQALPPLADAASSSTEFGIVAVPTQPLATQIRDLLSKPLTVVDVVATTNPDEIVFYREMPQLSLSDLPQLGAVAETAYRQMSAIEHFSPHSRIDIGDWSPNPKPF
ncbi:MAG: tubulin-like doman-containing protein [Gemmataceae bacterium]